MEVVSPEVDNLKSVVDAIVATNDENRREEMFLHLTSDADWLCAIYRSNPLRASTEIGRLVKVKEFSSRARELKTLIKQQLRADTVSKAEQLSSRTAAVGDVAGAPPEVAGLSIPSEYEVRSDGIYRCKIGEGGVVESWKIAHRPVFVAGRSVDRDSGEVWLRLVWQTPTGSWQSYIAARQHVMDSRKLCDISGLDGPISSTNANAVVRWLSDFEAANAEDLKVERISSRLGWYDLDKPAPSFVLPEHTYGPSGLALVGGAGFEHMSAGWSVAGDFDRWSETIAAVADYPLMMLALYSSVAAPLVEYLGAPNFIVDFSDRTSGGKSTAARLAASVWGNPSENEGILYSWDETRVSALQKAAFLHNLPLILDESKRAKDKASLSQTIYDFCHGRDRGRGRKEGGIRKQLGWHTILISNGESPLALYTTDAGTKARVISLRGLPLGRDKDRGAQLAHYVADSVGENYGHFGRTVLRYLVEDVGSRRNELVAEYRKFRDYYSARQEHAVSGRVAVYVAVLAVAASICKELGLAEPSIDPLELALEAAGRAGDEADIPLLAMQDLVSWCATNQQRFYGRGSDVRTPLQGYAGSWRGGDDWERLVIVNQEARKIVESMGYHYEEVRTQWAEYGFIETGYKKQPTRTERVGNDAVRAIVIPRSTYEGVFGVPDNERRR